MKNHCRDFAMGLGAALLLLGACVSKDVIPKNVIREAVPRPVEEPAAPLVPRVVDWANTTWILPHSSGRESKQFPGYRGFHLSQNGHLYLVNVDGAVGGRWSADGNLLRLEFLEGESKIIPEGDFRCFEVTDQDEAVNLVPQSLPDGPGIVFHRAESYVDIIENHWIPRDMAGGETVHWPMNREIHIILLPNTQTGLGILGYGGENRFHGTIELGEDKFILGPLATTLKVGPASEFENLFVGLLTRTTHYVQVHNDLFLYAGTRQLLAFRMRLFT